MAIGVRKITLDYEGEDLDIILWASMYGDVTISVECYSGNDHYELETAKQIADAINQLLAWAATPTGQAKIKKAIEGEKKQDEAVSRRSTRKKHRHG